VKAVDELSLDDVLLDEGDLDDALYEFNDIGLPLRIAELRDAADARPPTAARQPPPKPTCRR